MGKTFKTFTKRFSKRFKSFPRFWTFHIIINLLPLLLKKYNYLITHFLTKFSPSRYSNYSYLVKICWKTENYNSNG